METQRLRNLTTGKLHTDIGFVYQDLEFITGMKGLMTHMLPNVLRAVKPWLKEKVSDTNYWDGEYSPDLKGGYPLEAMNDSERKEMLNRYADLPHPFSNMGEKKVIAIKV